MWSVDTVDPLLLQMFEVCLPSLVKQMQRPSSTALETALHVETIVWPMLHLPTKTLPMIFFPLFYIVLALLFECFEVGFVVTGREGIGGRAS